LRKLLLPAQTNQNVSTIHGVYSWIMSAINSLNQLNFTVPTMRNYLVKTPRLLKAAYSSCIWHIRQNNNSVYFTFDDGPHPEVTPYVLQQLEKYNAKATFFCIGKNVKSYEQVYQQVQDAGHTIGNHTFNHFNGFKVQNEDYLLNIARAGEVIKSDLFRPPYGRITPSQIKLIKHHYPQMKIVMWDVLTGDFDVNLSPEACLKHTLKAVEPGSIIVFHDSAKAEKRLRYVLPKLLEHCSNKGWQMKAL
jgi:peptidoglycan-N-acetylglucosamine deacetylase